MTLLFQQQVNHGFSSDYYNEDEDDEDDDERHRRRYSQQQKQEQQWQQQYQKHSQLETLSLSREKNDKEFTLASLDSLKNSSSSLIDSGSITNESSRIKCSITYAIDSILSAILFTLLSALYWYGTWAVVDEYFLPEAVFLSSMLTYIAGVVILFPSYMLQDVYQRTYDKQNKIMKFLFRNLHVYINGWAYVLSWRGTWYLIDYYLDFGWEFNVLFAIAAILYLLIARSLRFTTSAPFLLTLDKNEFNFQSNSRYKFRSIKNKHLQHFIDFFIAEFIECFVINIAWRNIALYFDKLIYPDDRFMDAVVSAGIGYGIYFLIISCQTFVYKKAATLSLIPRLIIEDFIYLLMFTSVIILWRIYWTIPETYIYNQNADYKIHVFLGTHCVGFIGSMVLFASQIVLGSAYNLKDGKFGYNGSPKIV